MAANILIILAGTVVLTGILIVLIATLRDDRHSGKDLGTRRGIAVSDGVDAKNLVVGIL